MVFGQIIQLFVPFRKAHFCHIVEKSIATELFDAVAVHSRERCIENLRRMIVVDFIIFVQRSVSPLPALRVVLSIRGTIP